MSPVKLSKVQQTAARQEKKQKRKAEEGKLHVKRQEMDKAKVLGDLHPFIAFLWSLTIRQTLLVSSWSNGAI